MTERKTCNGCSYCRLSKDDHDVVNHIFRCSRNLVHRENHYCICRCGLTKDNHDADHKYKCSFCKNLTKSKN